MVRGLLHMTSGPCDQEISYVYVKHYTEWGMRWENFLNFEDVICGRTRFNRQKGEELELEDSGREKGIGCIFHDDSSSRRHSASPHSLSNVSSPMQVLPQSRIDSSPPTNDTRWMRAERIGTPRAARTLPFGAAPSMYESRSLLSSDRGVTRMFQ